MEGLREHLAHDYQALADKVAEAQSIAIFSLQSLIGHLSAPSLQIGLVRAWISAEQENHEPTN